MDDQFRVRGLDQYLCICIDQRFDLCAVYDSYLAGGLSQSPQLTCSINTK